MHTYMSATNIGLPVNPDAEYRNLFLDVDYQVENSEVVVKSVRFHGHDRTTPVVSEDARLAIALQIYDSLVFGY
ncbi:MAG: hypothetical protein ACR2KU_05040 [Gammaproteobacteria bacterium]